MKGTNEEREWEEEVKPSALYCLDSLALETDGCLFPRTDHRSLLREVPSRNRLAETAP